jgi:dTDP-4-dehydrorhamnose 3,5-epimerase-like enzyme
MKIKKLKVDFKDKRGSITDIFYKKNINHVAIIKSKKGVRRGDHYHKRTTQYMYCTKGELEYWYKKRGSKQKSKKVILKVGYLIETPPNEMHALKIIKNNEFIVFTTGLRGGKDYEKDTFRFRPTIIR